MTTQELKNKIEKVLGNSIRCLLPSYWWKNLFHSVADRIDEVEQSTSELIDSKVEEVKMPIVESVDELEKLKLAKGRVAAVEKVGEPVIVNYEDCYISSDYVNDWDKYTIVRGVIEIGEVPLDAEAGSIYLMADKHDLEADTIAIGIEDGRRLYGKFSGGRFSYITLDKVNEYLASGRYRLTGGYLSDRIAQYFTFYLAKPQPSLYIKGDSWERLAKESDITGEGGNTSGDGLIFGKERYAYVSKHKDVNGNITELELSEEQRTYNQETYEMLESGSKVYLSYEGTFWMQVGYAGSHFYFSTASMVFPYDNKVFGRMIEFSSDGEIALIDTLVGGSSSDITVDTEMSDTSENSVQNKVIKKYIDDNLSEAEKVHAAALDDLGTKIRDIEARLNNAGL